MENIFHFLQDFLQRPDKVLMDIINNYGYWIYFILFGIIFAETGLIVIAFLMPFLPGDALIFSVGMIAANDIQDHLHIEYIIPLLMLAAILGDNLNYYIGKKFGSWILSKEDNFFVKKNHIENAVAFFDKNGKKAIIIARFIPVVRTIIPFICGTTQLKYKTFISYSFIGAILWVGLISFLGFKLGQFDIVKNNLEKFIIAIIVIANTPLIIRLINSYLIKNKTE